MGMTKKASQTKMSTELDSWTRRGCHYVLDHCGIDEDDRHEIMVDAYNAKDELLWSGPTTWTDGDTVADVLRRAKDQADGWRSRWTRWRA